MPAFLSTRLAATARATFAIAPIGEEKRLAARIHLTHLDTLSPQQRDDVRTSEAPRESVGSISISPARFRPPDDSSRRAEHKPRLVFTISNMLFMQRGRHRARSFAREERNKKDVSDIPGSLESYCRSHGDFSFSKLLGEAQPNDLANSARENRACC